MVPFFIHTPTSTFIHDRYKVPHTLTFKERMCDTIIVANTHITLETLGTDPAGVWHRHFDFDSMNMAIDALGHEGICKAIMSMHNETADSLRKWNEGIAAAYMTGMSIAVTAAFYSRHMTSEEVKTVQSCVEAISHHIDKTSGEAFLNGFGSALETLEQYLEAPYSIPEVSVASAAWRAAFVILPLEGLNELWGAETLDTEVCGVRFAFNTLDRHDWNSDDGYDHWTLSFALKHVMAQVK